MVKAVTIKDTGYKEYYQSLTKINRSKVKVGLFAKLGNELIIYAATNEFGTTKAGKLRNVIIPARSFIRSTFNEQVSKVVKRYEKILANPTNYDKKLKLIGLDQVSKIQQKIIDIKTPANKPSTIKRKGSSNPLVDTGAMGKAVNYEVQYK